MEEQSTTHVCPHSHSYFLDNFIRKLFQNPKKILGEYINTGDTVVDIGCGPGFFTMEMAKLTGDSGKVIAVDLQPEMLEKVEKKSKKLNLLGRIVLHQCLADRLNINNDQKADFILAYYMVHETPDHESFLKEVKTVLKKNGKFLIVEPKFHVSRQKFEDMLQTCKKIGFNLLDQPLKKGGRSVLLSV